MPRFPRMAPSAIGLSNNVYSELLERARQRGTAFFPLHVGDTYVDPPIFARAEQQRVQDLPRLHAYPPVQGDPELLEAIAERLRLREPKHAPAIEQIQVMPGATAGLHIVCESLLAPGEEVLLPSPYWPLIRGIFQSRGVHAKEIALHDLSSPESEPLSAEALHRSLEENISPATTAIYVNTIHNPTGRFLGADVLEAIADIARAHDLWILSDEAYDDLYYIDTPPAPLWAHPDPDVRARTVASHTLSKSYAFAGGRVGYTHGPEGAMAQIRGLQTFLTYAAARPMQKAGARALRNGADWLANVRATYAAAARQTRDTLSLPHPIEGSTFAFFDVGPYVGRGEDCRAFLEKALDLGVLLTPGHVSGKAYKNWVRLCFTAAPPHELTLALERIASLMNRP